MNNEFKYPTTYELEEIFSQITDNKFLNQFAQKKGLFITNKKQSDLAKELSNLYYDEHDLEEIRRETYQMTSTHTLTGFVITSIDQSFNLKQSYDWIIERGEFGIGRTLNGLLKVGEENNVPVYRGSLEYKKSKPGKLEFLQNETGNFDFYISEQKKGTWKVEIDCNKSTDLKELKDLLVKNIHYETIIDSIELDLLKTANTITFFDQIAKAGLGEDWMLVDTKNLCIKHFSEKKIKIDIDEDNIDENIDLEEDKRQGITEAILQGKNLRNEPFVEELIQKGFGFTAMTYEFKHKKQPYFIEVSAEFKGRPKVFEVGIAKYQNSVGLMQKKEDLALNNSESRNFRSILWNNAKKIFDSLSS